MEKELPNLDKSLRQLAIDNWHDFIKLVGDDAILHAKICLMRKEGKSYGKITVAVGVTKRKAQSQADRCRCDDE